AAKRAAGRASASASARFWNISSNPFLIRFVGRQDAAGRVSSRRVGQAGAPAGLNVLRLLADLGVPFRQPCITVVECDGGRDELQALGGLVTIGEVVGDLLGDLHLGI